MKQMFSLEKKNTFFLFNVKLTLLWTKTNLAFYRSDKNMENVIKPPLLCK